MDKQDIKSLTLEQMTTTVKELGLPAFRAEQIFTWIHQKGAVSFEEMTNLSAQLRQQLEEKFYINSLIIKKKLVSAMDGTVKYLYGLKDGNCIESVLMHYKHGNSLCISTQVGCRMGCRFCASTLEGLVRNLTAAEMADQIYHTVKDSGARVDSLVLMGIGEPLDNYDNVLDFLKIISSPKGYQLGSRHISLSTCGLVEQIDRLAQEDLQITLSISLHAPNDQIRTKTMPVNSRWNMDTLLASCRRYFTKTGRRISFEYALIEGVNDTPKDARELAHRLKGMVCHVNLIPVNSVKERGYRRSSKARVEEFLKELTKLKVNATVRRELGSDINAACGQLRRETGKNEEDTVC